jgi:hypothetical protein
MPELLPTEESEEFDCKLHSVTALVCGASLPILLELLSIKYTLPVEGSNFTEVGKLLAVGISQSVIVLVNGASLPILFSLLSTKYISLPLNELVIA